MLRSAAAPAVTASADASADIDEQAIAQQAANQPILAEQTAEADIHAETGVHTEPAATTEQASEKATGTDADTHTEANTETCIQATGIGSWCNGDQRGGGDGKDSDLLHDVLSTVVCPFWTRVKMRRSIWLCNRKGIFTLKRPCLYDRILQFR
jgi:hypothetical protein